MPFLTRLSTVVAVALVSFATANAQSIKSPLPREAELNRLGLTMAWWAQASVNPLRDKVEFFTADEQNVFVQSTTGIVSSFHAEQGRKLWSNLVGTPDQQTYPVTTSDEEALITVGLQLYALDKMTGQTRWELTSTEYPSTSPELNDTQIFIGTLDGSVLAYNLPEVRKLYARGMLPQWTVRARMWNFQTPALIVSPPISVGDEVIFASKRGVVYGLLAKDKELRFQLEAGNEVQTPLGYSNDRLFVADRNARMLCMNLMTGRVIWTFAGGSPIGQQPRVVGNMVYVVPHREGLTALLTTTGTQQWQNIRATQFIAATDNHVYASDESKNLLVLEKATGHVIGSVNMRDFPLRVPNDRTDRIFLCSPTGTIVALREIGSEYPVYHLHPDRRPILPELAPEEAAPGEENANN